MTEQRSLNRGSETILVHTTKVIETAPLKRRADERAPYKQ